MKRLMENFRKFINEVEGPRPSDDDIYDAIEHAESAFRDLPGWTTSDFEMKYLGELTVDDLRGYDDIDSWLETDEGDPESLEDYRSSVNWSDISASWGTDNIPPIIITTAPMDEEGGEHTQVSDGRGRVNYANAMDTSLHVWHMEYSGEYQ